MPTLPAKCLKLMVVTSSLDTTTLLAATEAVVENHVTSRFAGERPAPRSGA